MSARYISYASQARPTRDEVIEALVESHIVLTKTLKKLEKLVKREFVYIANKRKKLEDV